MPKFQKATIAFFDSNVAHFKVSVEAMTTRARQDGTVGSLAYITNKGTAVLNPNIYLVFTYRGEEKNAMGDKSLYTSYPHLFKVRAAFQKVLDMLHDPASFVDDGGTLLVAPTAKEPVIIDNIGKEAKWMTMTLQSVEMGAENNSVRDRGVSIQIAEAPFASVLSYDEFAAVYSIIMDINLPVIQTMLSLECVDEAPSYGGGFQSSYAPQPQYQPQAPVVPQQGGYQNPQQYQQQRGGTYNRTGGGYNRRASAAPQPQYNNQPVGQPAAQTPQYQASVAPQQGTVPPQASQPAYQPPVTNRNPVAANPANPVNMSEVAAAPVENVNWDEPGSVDALFDEE